MELLDVFDGQIEVPLIQELDQVKTVVSARKLFEDAAEEADAFQQLEVAAGKRLLPGIGVKRLIAVIERVRQAPDGTKPITFVNTLLSAMDR